MPTVCWLLNSHSNGRPFIMTAQSHTEFVEAFYRISQDRANKIVILTGAGGEFITDVEWSSFGDVADPGVWSQIHDEGVQALENIANIRVPVIRQLSRDAPMCIPTTRYLPASLWRRKVRPSRMWPTSRRALLPVTASLPPGVTALERDERRRSCWNPQPLAARTAYEWGVVAEVVPSGKALGRSRELAELYLKAPEVTRRNTRIHFIQPLKERIVREVGYGLSLEGASSADLVRSMQAKREPVARKGKVA